MWKLRLSRRKFIALGGTAVLNEIFGRALAGSFAKRLRIGVLVPTRTEGGIIYRQGGDEIAGEAARKGAVLASEVVGYEADLLGVQLDVLISTAPTEDAAIRAAQRLVATEEVFAIVGGFGTLQAEALSQFARDRQVLFLNIGALNDILRGDACSPYTFHIEASAAMYLDAIAAWFAESSICRWHLIYEDSDEGVALYQRALKAINKWNLETCKVSSNAISPDVPIYSEALTRIREVKPEVVLLLLDWLPQLDFLGHYEAEGLPFAVTGLPHSVTQTREFFGISRNVAPYAGSGYRVTLWETTLSAHGAKTLNEHFMARWGEPMDPPAWAAYQAVRILFEAAIWSETLDGAELVSYLESPQAVFDVQKGMYASFRPWDHQLRQNLYVVKIQPEAEPGLMLSKKVAWAKLAGELPRGRVPSSSSIERLDLLGDGPDRSRCRF